MGQGFPSSNRRRFLAAVSSTGLAALAGCNTEGSRDNNSTATATETVVFTDSATPSPSSTPTTQVFDGGDIAAFKRALLTASNLGVSLDIDPGTYTFAPMTSGKQAHLQLRDIHDLTVDGNGSKIVFSDPLKGGFRFRRGTNITIRNLEFDFNPVPFTQGEITAVSTSEGTITVALDDGYPALDHEMFQAAAIVFGLPHDPDGSFVQVSERATGSPDKYFRDIENPSGRTYRLHLNTEKSGFVGISPGHRLTIVARNNDPVLNFYKVTNPTTENVTARTANGGGFSHQACKTPTVRSSTISPPPESDRQLATVADGIRITNCSNGSVIENCVHEKLGDDSVAVDCRMVTVQTFNSDSEISVNGLHPFVVTEGDILEGMAPNGVLRGELPAIERYTSRFSTPSDREKPDTITFSEPVTDIIETGDYLANTATASDDYVIRNNEFREHRARLIRANSGTGLIEGNLLERADGSAIELRSGTKGFWPPKRQVENVTVRGNTIRGAGMRYISNSDASAIHLHFQTPDGITTDGRPNRNIEIVDNDIGRSASIGIRAEATEGLRIEGNTMENLNVLEFTANNYGIDISNLRNVNVEENTVSGAAAYLSGFGFRRNCKQVSASENTLILDGEQRSAEFTQYIPVTFTFNRAVIPSSGDDRKLTFRCFTLDLLTEDGSVVQSVNVGGAESGVSMGDGVYGRERANGVTWRWFGPESVLYFLSDDLANAAVLRLRGYSIEGGITASVRVDGIETGVIEWTDSQRDTYSVSLQT